MKEFVEYLKRIEMSRVETENSYWWNDNGTTQQRIRKESQLSVPCKIFEVDGHTYEIGFSISISRKHVYKKTYVYVDGVQKTWRSVSKFLKEV